MEHSALPWKFEPLTGDDDRGMGYIVDANGEVVDHHGNGAKWKADNLANAYLKIRACNSHDALLEALKLAAEYKGLHWKTKQVIDAAIALAEGR